MSYYISYLTINIRIMRSLMSIAKKLTASVAKVRHINVALFGLVLLLAGMAIGHTSVPQFVREAWAAMIDGSGTVGTVPAFAASGSTIGDSIMSQSGSTITVQGDIKATNNMYAAGFINAPQFNGKVSDGGGAYIQNGSVIGVNSIAVQGAGLYPTNGGTVNANHAIFFDYAGTNATFTGTMSATTKNFVIDHPLKDGYQLVHSSLEGPEVGVFYRGSAKLVNGRAIVALPDYFDALTRDHTATELLTAKGSAPFLLSYDRFDEKSFVVHGAQADGEFDWEVKATRADVAPLEVERKK